VATRLQTRLMLLLAAVVIAAVALTLIAVRASLRDSGVERMARALHVQVAAADALVRDLDRAAAVERLDALGFAWKEALPPDGRPALPLTRRIEAQLGARIPGRPLRLSGRPAQLWVRAQPPASGWIGIPLFGEVEPLRRSLVLWLLALGALIALAAGLFARTLTSPLHALATAAPGIVAGHAPTLPPRRASAEIVELHRALVDAAAATRAAARDRELMLAGLSHDMRTPLARLRYALAVDDDEARAGMERDIDELDAIIGGFIDYVRDGRDEQPADFDLAGLLRSLAQAEARRGNVWSLEVPEAAPMRGRPQALRRALANLLDNAARYGAPPFVASLAPDARGWRVCVRDHGGGVPDNALPELGRPFHRVDAARRGGGSGLGLASVARIAVLHGGRLSLRNHPDGGLQAELHLDRQGDANAPVRGGTETGFRDDRIG
jgi:two-component system osmolarity sensor histidine kinase EnvZ